MVSTNYERKYSDREKRESEKSGIVLFFHKRKKTNLVLASQELTAQTLLFKMCHSNLKKLEKSQTENNEKHKRPCHNSSRSLPQKEV